jgi:hypothetical protein
MAYMDLWILCDGVDPDRGRQIERLRCDVEVRINRVPSGESPLLHIVSGQVPLRIHAMKWYSTAVQPRTAQLCTVVRRRPHSAALKKGMWGFSFLLRQK